MVISETLSKLSTCILYLYLGSVQKTPKERGVLNDSVRFWTWKGPGVLDMSSNLFKNVSAEVGGLNKFRMAWSSRQIWIHSEWPRQIRTAWKYDRPFRGACLTLQAILNCLILQTACNIHIHKKGGEHFNLEWETTNFFFIFVIFFPYEGSMEVGGVKNMSVQFYGCLTTILMPLIEQKQKNLLFIFSLMRGPWG